MYKKRSTTQHMYFIYNQSITNHHRHHQGPLGKVRTNWKTRWFRLTEIGLAYVSPFLLSCRQYSQIDLDTPSFSPIIRALTCHTFSGFKFQAQLVYNVAFMLSHVLEHIQSLGLQAIIIVTSKRQCSQLFVRDMRQILYGQRRIKAKRNDLHRADALGGCRDDATIL